MRQTIFICLLASGLTLAGCSTTPDHTGSKPSTLESIPFVYRPDIQQGNIVTQEKFDQLQVGMSKKDVRRLLGTPLLVDVFHQDRWDYLYSMKKNNEAREQKTLSLFFENDALSRFDTDIEFDPEKDGVSTKETIVDVPDYVAPKKGLIERMLNTVGAEVQEE